MKKKSESDGEPIELIYIAAMPGKTGTPGSYAWEMPTYSEKCVTWTSEAEDQLEPLALNSAFRLLPRDRAVIVFTGSQTLLSRFNGTRLDQADARQLTGYLAGCVSVAKRRGLAVMVESDKDGNPAARFLAKVNRGLELAEDLRQEVMIENLQEADE